MLDSWKSRYRKHEERAYMSVENKVPRAVIKVISCRIISIMSLFISAILVTFAIIYHPWKEEFKSENTRLEVSIWRVCRKSSRNLRCYDDVLVDLPAWFQAFKWFLILSAAFQFIGCFFSIIKLVITENNGTRAFWIPSFLSLASAFMISTAMIILVVFWDFGFVDDARSDYMGFTDNDDTDEASGLPRDVAYWSIGTTLFTFLFCMYTHFVDDRFARSYDKIKTRLPTTLY